MVTVLVHHNIKDYNAFASRAAEFIMSLKPEKGWQYLKTYSAAPVKLEAWCVWRIANALTIVDFQKEFSQAIGNTGTVEPTWVTEFVPETFPPFQFVPKK